MTLMRLIISSVYFVFTCLTIINCIDCNAQSGPNDIKVRDYISPVTGLPTITQGERDIPVVGQADVVVAGGGLSGVIAALYAAEQGLSVIILEGRNYLGYELSGTYRLSDKSEVIKSSFTNSIYQDLIESNIVGDDVFRVQKFTAYLHKQVEENDRINVYFYSPPNGVIIKDNKVGGVLFSGMSGRQIVLAKSVIDATEFLNVAKSAGQG